uniref:YqaJ domain-containing protein n=1 Tax=Loa loa TaxID=7209 RepID=A0A1I7V904_LOALO
MFCFYEQLVAGQVIAYEIMQSNLVSCPLEMHKIPVPRCDAVFDAQCMGKTEIPFVRAKYDKRTGHGFNAPREQRTTWVQQQLNAPKELVFWSLIGEECSRCNFILSSVCIRLVWIASFISSSSIQQVYANKPTIVH